MNLSGQRKDRLITFLKDSFDDTLPKIQNRHERIKEWEARWTAKSRSKDYPWPGCSSIQLPIVATIKDAIDSRILNALLGSNRDLNVEPYIDEAIPGMVNTSGQPLKWRSVAEALETYLLFELSDAGQVPFRQYLNRLVDEVTMTGTGNSKISWMTRIEREATPTGKFLDVAKFSNVEFRCVPLENMIFPAFYDSFERIPFVAERYLMRPSEMLQAVDSHGWDTKEVRRYLREQGDSTADPLTIDEDSENFGGQQFSGREHWMAETWVRVPLDDEDMGREVKLVIDHPLQHPEYVFRVMAWPYDHGMLPFPDPARYIFRRGRLLGMGIPERASELDDALSTTANQIIDNSHLGNTNVWSVNETARGLRQLSTLRPGQVVKRGDDPNDIIPLKMGSVSPDIFEAFNILRDQLERVTKVSDYNLGRESSAMGQQGTATATLALLQESGQYFDTIARGIRSHVNEGLQMWLDLLVQNQPLERVSSILGRQEAELVLGALNLPSGDLRRRLGIKVAFSNTAATRELARQEEMAKWQIVDGWYRSLIEAAQLRLQVEPIAPLIDDVARNSEMRMRKLLEAWGEDYNTNDLPNWDAFLQAQQEMMQEQMAPELEEEEEAPEGMDPMEAQLRQMELEQQGAVESGKLDLEQQRVDIEREKARVEAENKEQTSDDS